MSNGKSQRNTRQRAVVLEELKRICGHPTAAELYGIARERLPKISLGTVYRNLEVLSQNGMIRKLQINGAEARFDANPEPHFHVGCIRCERIDDVRDLPEDFIQGQIQNLGGYDIVGFRLSFLGVCPDCQDECGTDGGEASLQKRK